MDLDDKGLPCSMTGGSTHVCHVTGGSCDAPVGGSLAFGCGRARSFGVFEADRHAMPLFNSFSGSNIVSVCCTKADCGCN